MRVHLFRGTGRVFAATADPEGANLPPGHGPWATFRTVEMIAGEPMPGIDVDAGLAEAHGFHLTDAHVRITDRALG